MGIFPRNACMLVTVLLVTTFSEAKCAGGEDQNFINFLMVEFRNYKDWLAEKNLDPTPLIPTVVDLSEELTFVHNISGDVRNQKVFGHSNIFTWEVSSKVSDASFNVKLDFHYNAFSTTGEYQAEGRLVTQNNATFTGEGHSNITAKTLVIEYQNYKITSEGFLSLNDASVKQEFVGSVPWVSGTFEGLNAGDHEELVEIKLALIYGSRLSSWLPVGDYMRSFLQEIFDKTPFADIVETS